MSSLNLSHNYNQIFHLGSVTFAFLSEHLGWRNMINSHCQNMQWHKWRPRYMRLEKKEKQILEHLGRRNMFNLHCQNMNRQQVQTTKYMCLNGKLQNIRSITRIKSCSTWIFFLEVQNRMLKRVAGVRNGKQDTIDRIADNMELWGG